MDLIAANGVCHRHRTSVRDSRPDMLVLYAPMEHGVAVYVPIGSEVTLWQQTETEAYVAAVMVIAVRPESRPLIVTTAPAKVDAVPRRRYCRVPTRLPFRAGVVAGEVRDISGSGALVAVPRGSLSPGRRLRVEIKLPGLPLPLRMEAKVIRISPADDHDCAGISFESISERVQDHIIRHVFVKQREIRAALRQSG